MGTWRPGVTLAQLEKETIITALRVFQNNRTHTANSLGISIRTLRNKLAEYEGRASDEGELQGTSGSDEKNEKDGVQSRGGPAVEPVIEIPTKQPMPVQVGKKVQKMSQKLHANGNTLEGSDSDSSSSK